MQEKFCKEFERRLFRLQEVIERYQKTGVTSNILPFLFSAYSFCYCRNPFKNLKNEKHRK